MPTLPHSMTACRVHAFGPPSAIELEQVPVPEPGPGEVLIRVAAVGVGPWDGWIRAGKSALPQPLPLTLGSDLSGTVASLGVGVTHVAAGDAVFGVTNARFTGAYAEFAIADATMIAKQPAGLDVLDAAALPVIAVTAWQGLFDQAKLERGQSVLIHGGAGNVGAYAVQLAHRHGLRVVTTVSTEDVGLARMLGAAEVIDHRATAFETVVHEVDAVLDLVGGETQTRSFNVLKRGGALISAVSQPDQERARERGVRATFFFVKVTTELLKRIGAMVQAHQLTTSVGTVLPLASARIAHEMLEGQRPHPRGKIVLQLPR